MTTIHVFLVDDHLVVREGLKALITVQSDMEVVGEASDGATAWPQVCACLPDVVLMDISMPHMNGIQATVEIKHACPQVKVLILSVHDDTSYLRQLLAVGASGYILKHTAADALIQAIRHVAAGGVYFDPALAHHVIGHTAQQTATSELLSADLSKREIEVIQRVAQGHSNKDIAIQLALSLKTVETSRARAMRKLGIQSRAALVRYALQRGWLRST